MHLNYLALYILWFLNIKVQIYYLFINEFLLIIFLSQVSDVCLHVFSVSKYIFIIKFTEVKKNFPRRSIRICNSSLYNPLNNAYKQKHINPLKEIGFSWVCVCIHNNSLLSYHTQ